jgi:hypothetical protein
MLRHGNSVVIPLEWAMVLSYLAAQDLAAQHSISGNK